VSSLLNVRSVRGSLLLLLLLPSPHKADSVIEFARDLFKSLLILDRQTLPRSFPVCSLYF